MTAFTPKPFHHPPPPTLTMDEYADFIMDSLAHADPDKVLRQKAIEEQIRVPFRYPSRLELRASQSVQDGA